MTAREIFDEMTDKELSQVYSILANIFETHSHLVGLSDDDMANLSIKLFGEEDDNE